MSSKLNANAQAVLAVVRAMDNHPMASDIYEEVKRVRPRIGLASVYRILHTLVKENYIREIGADAGGNRYDARTSRHDHAVCTECGALLDLPSEIIVSPETLQQAAWESGIELGSYEVRVYGRCRDCQVRE